MSHFNAHNKDLFSGVLHKCGAKVKSWNKRWMVLKSDYCLYYYKDVAKKSLGSITLRDKCFKTRKGERGDCSWPKNVNMEHTIVMVTSSRTYYMFAESADEAEEWKQILQKTHEQLREEVRHNNPLLSEGASSKRSSALSMSSSSSSVQLGNKDVSDTQVELCPERDNGSMPRDYETAYSKDELEKIRFSLGESVPSLNGIGSNGSGGGEVLGGQVDAIYDLAKPEGTPPAEDYEAMNVSSRSTPTDIYEDMSGTGSHLRSPSPPEADTYEEITVHNFDMQEDLMSTSARDLPLPPLPVVGDVSAKLTSGLPLYEDIPENTLTRLQQPLYEDVCIDTDSRIGDMRESMQEAEDSGNEEVSTNSLPPPLPPKDTNVLPLPPKSVEDTTVNAPAKEKSPVLTREEIKPTPPAETDVAPLSPHRETNATPPSPHRQMNLTLPIDKANASPPMASKETSVSPPSPRKRKDVTPPSPRKWKDVTPPSPRKRKNVTPPSPHRTNVTPPPPDRETIVTPPSPCRRNNVTPPSPRRTNITSPDTENSDKNLSPPIPHRETRPTTPPSPRVWTPPPSNLSPSPIPKPRSRSNTSTHPPHPSDRMRSPKETFSFPPLPPKEPPKKAVSSGGGEPLELASLPPKVTLNEIVSRGPEDEAVYDKVLFEEEASVSESSRKETLERGMALFLKCQERVKISEDDCKKRTESIRVMESNDPSLSAEDKRLFVETLREVENERIRASEERFSWERERMKLEEERRLLEQEKRKLREELEKTRQQIQNT